MGDNLAESTDALADKLRNATSDDLEKKFGDCDSLGGCIMTSGAVLYLPAAVVCAERTIGGSHVYGIKKVVVVPTHYIGESYAYYAALIDRNKEEVGHSATRAKMLELLQTALPPLPPPLGLPPAGGAVTPRYEQSEAEENGEGAEIEEVALVEGAETKKVEGAETKEVAQVEGAETQKVKGAETKD